MRLGFFVSALGYVTLLFTIGFPFVSVILLMSINIPLEVCTLTLVVEATEVPPLAWIPCGSLQQLNTPLYIPKGFRVSAESVKNFYFHRRQKLSWNEAIPVKKDIRRLCVTWSTGSAGAWEQFLNEVQAKQDDVEAQNRTLQRLTECDSEDRLNSMNSFKDVQFFEGLNAELLVDPNYCCSCGVELQTKHAEKGGFFKKRKKEYGADVGLIDEDSTKRNEDSAVLQEAENFPLPSPKIRCQRCCLIRSKATIPTHLRADHYGNGSFNPLYFKKLVSKLRTKRCIFLYLLDAHDFRIIPEIDVLIGENPIYVALNKADLFPIGVSEQRIIGWVHSQMQMFGLKQLKPCNIHLISALKGKGLKVLLSDIWKQARLRRRDVYIIGVTNTGKSSLVNHLIAASERNHDNNRKKSSSDLRKKTQITTSPFPGTTLNFLKLDVGENFAVYDTPGLLLPGSIHERLSNDEIRSLLPSKYASSKRSISLMPDRTLLLGGMARVEVNEGGRCMITPYFSDKLKLGRCKTPFIDRFLRTHVGNDLYPPGEYADLERLTPLVPHNFEICGRNIRRAIVDIHIYGLGWFAVNSSSYCMLRVLAPEGVSVEARSPLLPFEKIRF